MRKDQCKTSIVIILRINKRLKIIQQLGLQTAHPWKTHARTHGKTHGTDLPTQICVRVRSFERVRRKSRLRSFCTESMKQAWLFSRVSIRFGLQWRGHRTVLNTPEGAERCERVSVCIKEKCQELGKSEHVLGFSMSSIHLHIMFLFFGVPSLCHLCTRPAINDQENQFSQWLVEFGSSDNHKFDLVNTTTWRF